MIFKTTRTLFLRLLLLSTEEPKLQSYGGQAVIEGVMMRGSKSLAVAVRDPEEEIQFHTQVLGKAYRSKWAKLPFVRGLFGIWDALGLGMRSMVFSADVASGEEVEFEGPIAWGTIAVSMLLGITLFSLFPAFVGEQAEAWFGVPPLASNIGEGIFRLIIIMTYIWAIGKMDDVQRLFGYHGAEHKTIHAFEADDELTPERVQTYPLEHPRCGTAFLLVVVLLSILIFSLLGDLTLLVRLGTRIALLPVLASIAFEYLYFTSRHLDNPLVRVLIVPSMALQRMTTRQPDEGMLEVAIASFQKMRSAEDLTEEQLAEMAAAQAA